MADSDQITRLNAALEGQYRVESTLGEGGMAVVFLATDVKHKRNVAVKVLRPELAAVVGAERFLAEIETTANLQHPHILPLYDSGAADGFLFYVMPYIEGETLADRLEREKQLPVDEAVKIASDVAEALHAAHEQGVIHRDVKPANILLSSGRPLVADFGIALAVSAAGGGRLTETGLSMGTPYYMSPEQASADREPTASSDVYSLGCVLYEMLVGDPPHTGSSAQAVLAKILTEEAPDATKTRASIPANVDAAIRKSLQKLPADRFSGAHDFSRALADAAFRYGEGAAVPAMATAPRWDGIKTSLAAATLVFGALAGWALFADAPPRAVSQYSLALSPEQAFIPSERVRHLAVDPHGEWFVYRGGESLESSQLFLRRHDQLLATPVPGSEGAGNPAVSPDGSMLAFTCCDFGRSADLLVAAISGGPPIPLVVSEVNRGGVSWGSDGYIYYDGGGEGDGLARVREGGGTPENVTTLKRDDGEDSHNGPHALPGGRGLLFEVLRSDRTRDIAVADLTTGEHTILARGAIGPRYSTTGHLLYVSVDGTMLAAPFDAEALNMTGDPVALLDGVWVGGVAERTDIEVGADGTLMYIAGEGGSILHDVVWTTPQGVSSPIDPDWPAADVRDPALSPDGQLLAVTIWEDDEPHVWIKQLPVGRFSRFTVRGDGSRPAWTGDGRSLAFWSSRGGDGMQLYRRRADMSGPAELVPVPDLGEGFGVESSDVVSGQVTYSPDGNWMVVEFDGDIYAVELDSLGNPSGDPVDLLTSPANELHPAVSPDGRWLAYTSNSGSGFHVFVCAFPDCEAPYSVSSDRGTVPLWARDGSELFFRRGGFLVAVDVLPGETFDWGEERTLFSMVEFNGAWPHPIDVTEDGERFVLIRPAENAGEMAQLIVWRNFFEVLKERVPN